MIDFYSGIYITTVQLILFPGADKKIAPEFLIKKKSVTKVRGEEITSGILVVLLSTVKETNIFL